MSFFRPFDYKEKPDLPPEASARYGFLSFWELVFRRLPRLIALNIIYFIITLPLLAMVFLLINAAGSEAPALFGGLSPVFALFSYMPQAVYIVLLVLSALLYGPATMGLTYVLRNFARGEHAWMSDFPKRSISNFRQGLVFGILDITAAYFLINGIASGGSASVLASAGLAIWAFIRHYTYLIAVTIEQSVFSILKNACLLVIIALGRSMTAGAAVLAITAVCFLISRTVTALTVPFVFYSLMWLAVIYICYPTVRKYIIDPALEAERNNPPAG